MQFVHYFTLKRNGFISPKSIDLSLMLVAIDIHLVLPELWTSKWMFWTDLLQAVSQKTLDTTHLFSGGDARRTSPGITHRPDRNALKIERLLTNKIGHPKVNIPVPPVSLLPL